MVEIIATVKNSNDTGAYVTANYPTAKHACYRRHFIFDIQATLPIDWAYNLMDHLRLFIVILLYTIDRAKTHCTYTR